jgi:hypothetical protein
LRPNKDANDDPWHADIHGRELIYKTRKYVHSVDRQSNQIGPK